MIAVRCFARSWEHCDHRRFLFGEILAARTAQCNFEFREEIAKFGRFWADIAKTWRFLLCSGVLTALPGLSDGFGACNSGIRFVLGRLSQGQVGFS